jgi:pimeloyl-ACP methyl ester carboxylesterase
MDILDRSVTQLIAHETQPTQTVAAMVRADQRLKKEFPRITLPVLILHGTGDQDAKPSGPHPHVSGTTHAPPHRYAHRYVFPTPEVQQG